MRVRIRLEGRVWFFGVDVGLEVWVIFIVVSVSYLDFGFVEEVEGLEVWGIGNYVLF